MGIKCSYFFIVAERVNGEQPSLYELLLQRELLADKMDAEGRGHFVVRKSDRSPSLRHYLDVHFINRAANPCFCAGSDSAGEQIPMFPEFRQIITENYYEQTSDNRCHFTIYICGL